MSDDNEYEDVPAYSVEALPGHVIVQTFAPMPGGETAAQMTLTLSVKETIRLIAALTDSLDDATEGYDWSELDAEVSGE